MAVGSHPRGDDDSLGNDVVVVSHVQVGGIEVEVREGVVVEAAVLEGAHVLVEACADARDLRAGDARGDAEGLHELVDGAGGDPVHVGLHHDGIERLVDAPARLEDGGEEASLSQLGDAEADVAGLGGHEPGAMAVALVGSRLGALVEPGADRLGRLGLDELLEDDAHGLPDEVHAVDASERVGEVGEGRLVEGHRVISLVGSARNTPRITPMGPPTGGWSRSPQSPPLRGTLSSLALSRSSSPG